MELYRNWGFRMDGTVLFYLKTPKEAMASIKIWLIIVLIITLYFNILAIIQVVYKFIVSKELDQIQPGKWPIIPVFLLLTGLSIIPMRGGVGIAPIRSGSVFFSPIPYANHAAINVQWNFCNSLLYMNKGKMEGYMPSKEADQLFIKLMKPDNRNIRPFIENR